MPLQHAAAVAAIIACVDGKSAAVQELPLPDDEAKLDLACMLHAWGALTIIVFKMFTET